VSRVGRLLGRCVLVLVALILLVGLVFFVAGERIYPRLLEIAARDGAGLTLSARGPVTLQLWPVVRVTARDVDVSSAASSAWNAQLRQISVQIAGRSVLRGEFVIEHLAVQGARVRINEALLGGAGLLDAMPSLAQARTRVDDARIEIKVDGAQQHIIQLDHYTSGPGPDGQPRIEARGSVNGNTLSIDGQFGAAAQRAGDVMAFPLTASVSIPGWKLDGTVHGHVVAPLQGKGLALETTLEIGDVAPLAQILNLPGPLTGRLKLRATLDGDLPSPRLLRIEATLEDGKTLSAGAEGTGIALASGDIESLRLRFKGPLLAGGADKRSPVRQASAEVTLKGTPGHYALTVDRARVSTNAKTWIEAKGSLELAALDDWAAARSRLAVKMSAPNTTALSRLLGGGLRSKLGPVDIRGQLSGALTAAWLKDLQLHIGAKGPVQITAKGQVGPLDLSGVSAPLAKTEADVQMEMTVREAKALQPDPKDVFVTLQPWSGHARLRQSGAHWRLSGLQVSAGSKRGVQLQVSGKASGRGDLVAGVQRIVTDALRKGDSADLEVMLDTATTQATARVIGVNVPELGALHGRAHIQEENGVLAMRGLELQSKGDFEIKLAGDIGALNGLRDVNLEVTLAPTRHENIDRLLDLELPLTGDVSLQATLRRPGTKALSVDGEVRVGSSRLALELTAERTSTVPLVKGRIHSSSILAADFWGGGEAPAVALAKASPSPKPSRTRAPSDGLGLLGILPGLDFILQDTTEQQERVEQVRSTPAVAAAKDKSEALPWRRLQHVDIELDVHVDSVQGVHITGGPLELRLVDKAGRLEFGPSKLAFKGGSVTIHGVADSNDEPPTLIVNGRGEDLPIDELAAHSGAKSKELAGRLSFDYDLKSRGHSLVDLRAALGGEIKSLIEDGQFPLQGLDLLSGDLLSWVTGWMSDNKDTPVPCAVAHLAIEDGIANVETLYLKTASSAVYGIGTIDLRSDTLNLTITPKVRGISLSPPPTVHIYGPLAAPQIEVANASAVVLHYGSEVAASLVFPPALLLGPLFGHTDSSEPSPCR